MCVQRRQAVCVSIDWAVYALLYTSISSCNRNYGVDDDEIVNISKRETCHIRPRRDARGGKVVYHHPHFLFIIRFLYSVIPGLLHYSAPWLLCISRGERATTIPFGKTRKSFAGGGGRKIINFSSFSFFRRQGACCWMTENQ